MLNALAKSYASMSVDGFVPQLQFVSPHNVDARSLDNVHRWPEEPLPDGLIPYLELGGSGTLSRHTKLLKEFDIPPATTGKDVVIIRGGIMPIYKQSGERDEDSLTSPVISDDCLSKHGIFEECIFVCLSVKAPVQEADNWLTNQLITWSPWAKSVLKSSGFPSLKEYISGAALGRSFEHDLDVDVQHEKFLLRDIPGAHRWVYTCCTMEDDGTTPSTKFTWSDWTTCEVKDFWPVIVPVAETGTLSHWFFRSVGHSDVLSLSAQTIEGTCRQFSHDVRDDLCAMAIAGLSWLGSIACVRVPKIAIGDISPRVS
eukprot:4216282-Amphidinium_carterae.1